MRKFISGLLLGMIIAFHLGINFGRDRPLLSNPYGNDVVGSVKARADEVIDNTKDTIHDVAKSGLKELEKKLD